MIFIIETSKPFATIVLLINVGKDQPLGERVRVRGAERLQYKQVVLLFETLNSKHQILNNDQNQNIQTF